MNKHRFPYKWYLKDGYPAKGIEKHGLKVFGTFICGGGSSMGYKLAGYNHLGGVEIDKEVAAIYKLNHNPKYLFNEDIRQFNERNDLPDELYDLDILDGSPPCSTFSMAGSREKAWKKEKKFREGQSMQTLDDLVFVYIDTIEKLKPKVCLLENVKGIIHGNAKYYSKQIVKKLNEIGYNVQVFLLNASKMGVPQRRERVFFIGIKNEYDLPKLKLEFNEHLIYYSNIRCKGIQDASFTEYDLNIWEKRQKGDKDYSDVLKRIDNRISNWNAKFIYDDQVCLTINSSSGSKLISFEEPKHISNDELKQIGSFPLDYDFKSIRPKYLIGMSVPPVMTAQIAHQIYKQWLKPFTVKRNGEDVTEEFKKDLVETD